MQDPLAVQAILTYALTIVQVFVCDARELVFRGLVHRRFWPCEWPRVFRFP